MGCDHVQWIEYDLVTYLQTKVEVAPNFNRMGLELAQKDRRFKTTHYPYLWLF